MRFKPVGEKVEELISTSIDEEVLVDYKARIYKFGNSFAWQVDLPKDRMKDVEEYSSFGYTDSIEEAKKELFVFLSKNNLYFEIES